LSDHFESLLLNIAFFFFPFIINLLTWNEVINCSFFHTSLQFLLILKSLEKFCKERKTREMFFVALNVFFCCRSSFYFIPLTFPSNFHKLEMLPRLLLLARLESFHLSILVALFVTCWFQQVVLQYQQTFLLHLLLFCKMFCTPQ